MALLDKIVVAFGHRIAYMIKNLPALGFENMRERIHSGYLKFKSQQIMDEWIAKVSIKAMCQGTLAIAPTHHCIVTSWPSHRGIVA